MRWLVVVKSGPLKVKLIVEEQEKLIRREVGGNAEIIGWKCWFNKERDDNKIRCFSWDASRAKLFDIAHS